MSVEDRLARLERRHGATVSAFVLIIVALIGATASQAYRIRELETAKTLRLKELRIYDDKGVDRVVIAGRLPPALYNGKPIRAPTRLMSGVLIYDESGTERGGYVTADGYANAMLTLDAKGHQSMMLLAEPGGGPFFRLWEGKGSVTMGVGDDGKPFMGVKDDKEILFAKPENNSGTTRGLRNESNAPH